MSTPDFNLLVTLDAVLAEGSVARLISGQLRVPTAAERMLCDAVK